LALPCSASRIQLPFGRCILSTEPQNFQALRFLRTRYDRLAAATSHRRNCEASILLNSVSRHNCLAAAVPFRLRRKVPRLFDSLCRRHCLSACRAFQMESARVRALRFSISAERLSRLAVSNRPLPIECSAQLRFKVAGPLKLSRKVLIRFPVQSATEDKSA